MPFLAVLLLTACHKEVELPTVDYYVTVSPSETYKRLYLSFNGIRAMQDADDSPGGLANRSVYIDAASLVLSTAEPRDTVFLGSSGIESGMLRGFDFWLSDFRVETKDRILQLADGTKPRIPEVKQDIFIEPLGNKRITFVIDVDSSVVLLPDGTAKFVAKISVVED